MNLDRIAEVVSRAREATSAPDAGASGADQRVKLERIAAEFESMLLGQMLKDMRQTGKWGDEEEGEGLGASSLFEAIDVELVSKLSAQGGLGLGQDLLKSLARQYNMAEPAEVATGLGSRGALAGIGAALAPAAAEVSYVASPAMRGVGFPDIAGVADGAAPAVTSAYGWRRDPLNGAGRFHAGVDLKAAYGAEVRAAAGGKVAFAGVQNGYGNTVVVEHPDGVTTRYAHLSATDVQVGEAVAEGQLLGRAGSSGRATGPHLHFEVSAGGQRVDPQAWVARLGSGFKSPQQIADLTMGESGRTISRGAHHED